MVLVPLNGYPPAISKKMLEIKTLYQKCTEIPLKGQDVISQFNQIYLQPTSERTYFYSPENVK